MGIYIAEVVAVGGVVVVGFGDVLVVGVDVGAVGVAGAVRCCGP